MPPLSASTSSLAMGQPDVKVVSIPRLHTQLVPLTALLQPDPGDLVTGQQLGPRAQQEADVV